MSSTEKVHDVPYKCPLYYITAMTADLVLKQDAKQADFFGLI